MAHRRDDAFCVFKLDVPPDVVPPPASRPFSGPSGSGVGGGGDGGPPDIEDGNDGRTTIARSRRPPPPPPKARATIAYAVSLTSCGDMAHRTGGGALGRSELRRGRGGTEALDTPLVDQELEGGWRR